MANVNTYNYEIQGLKVYELPTICLVGGCFMPCNFHIHNNMNGQPQDMTGCTAKFSVVNFLNKYGKPLIKKDMLVRQGTRAEEAGLKSILYVELNSDDTKDLEGKFIYQITVEDDTGHAIIPKHGVMYVIHNIDKSPLE